MTVSSDDYTHIKARNFRIRQIHRQSNSFVSKSSRPSSSSTVVRTQARGEVHSSSFANPITRHSSKLNSVHGCIISRVTLSLLCTRAIQTRYICQFNRALSSRFSRRSRRQTDCSMKLLRPDVSREIESDSRVTLRELIPSFLALSTFEEKQNAREHAQVS